MREDKDLRKLRHEEIKSAEEGLLSVWTNCVIKRKRKLEGGTLWRIEDERSRGIE